MTKLRNLILRPSPGLGNLLYIIYISEIGSLFNVTSVLGHLYADDIQASAYFSLASSAAVLVMSKALCVLETLMLKTEVQPVRNPIYLAWYLTAACKARPSHHCCQLPHFIFSPYCPGPWSTKSSLSHHIFTTSTMIHITCYASSS